MKKIILVISLVSTLLLVGCSTEINVENMNNQQNNNILENLEQDNEETVKQTPTEAIMGALKDSNWVKENITMKKTCFGEEFTSKQELTFEKLSDDLVAVQAICDESEEFGVQVFLVGYKDGNVKVYSMPQDATSNPRDTFYTIDTKKSVLLSIWGNLADINYIYYKLSNLGFEEIDKYTYYETLGDEWNEEEAIKFLEKYNTDVFSHELTDAELDKVFLNK